MVLLDGSVLDRLEDCNVRLICIGHCVHIELNRLARTAGPVAQGCVYLIYSYHSGYCTLHRKRQDDIPMLQREPP